MSKKRLPPKERSKLILDAALDLAKRDGFDNITRESVAKAAGISPGLVSNYFNTMNQLQRAVMRAAVAREVLEVVGQGLAARNEHALKAPHELKQRAIALMLAAE